MDIISSLVGLIFFIACCVTISRVGEIRDHARRQTALLERIAAQTKKEDPEKPAASSVNYNPLAEPKSGVGTLFLIIAAIVAVGTLVALFARRM